MLQVEKRLDTLDVLIKGSDEYNSPGLMPMVKELHETSLQRQWQMRGALFGLSLLLVLEGIVNWTVLVELFAAVVGR